MSRLVGGRDASYAYEFIDDVYGGRLANRVQITSDGHGAYANAVRDIFGIDVDYAQLVKQYGDAPESFKGRYIPSPFKSCSKRRIEGRPDPRHVYTHYPDNKQPCLFSAILFLFFSSSKNTKAAETMTRLAGKTAVVLGAAGKDNMGQVIARRLAREGATVMVAGRKAPELEALAKEVNGHFALCDITKRDEVFALADAAKSKLGRVDIAVNATGWGHMSPFLDDTEADLRAITDLQFLGPIFFFQAMVAAMIESGGGSLIQISSATATIMLGDHAGYMGTKAGVDHIIRCVANEFGAKGVRANSISPGLTDTPMNAAAKSVPGLFDAFVSAYPLGRIGTSEDIAAAVVWLAEDECFMTGQNLQVNGGLTLRRNPTRDEINASVMKASMPA